MSDNGNGHKPALKFPAPTVPIIGQPVTVKGWFFQVLVTCNCSARPEPVLIVGSVGDASQPCPLCGRRFVLQGIKIDEATGRQQLLIGMMTPTSEPDAGKENDRV